MGKPYSVISTSKGVVWTWSYANGLSGDTRAVSVRFKDGKLEQVPEIPFE